MLKTCINCCLADQRLIISLLAGTAFPPHHESPPGRRHGAGGGPGPTGWIWPWPVGTGRSCQALPAAGSVRGSPPSLPGAGGLEEPLLHREGPAQPASALAVTFNLSTAGTARELHGSSVGSAGGGGWPCPPLGVQAAPPACCPRA